MGSRSDHRARVFTWRVASHPTSQVQTWRPIPRCCHWAQAHTRSSITMPDYSVRAQELNIRARGSPRARSFGTAVNAVEAAETDWELGW